VELSHTLPFVTVCKYSVAVLRDLRDKPFRAALFGRISSNRHAMHPLIFSMSADTGCISYCSVLVVFFLSLRHDGNATVAFVCLLVRPA